MNIKAARFKAECLQLMDQVEKSREPIIITKHGRAVAQLAPVSSGSGSLFGYMKETTRTRGDLIGPVGEKWSAVSGDEDHLYRQVARRRPKKK
jgi:prevent-host-death family protein